MNKYTLPFYFSSIGWLLRSLFDTQCGCQEDIIIKPIPVLSQGEIRKFK